MKDLILVTGGNGKFAKVLKSKNKILNIYFANKKECNILMSILNVNILPCLSDNYSYVIHDKSFNKVIAIDRDFQRSRGPRRPTIIPASYWEDKKDMFQYLERIDFKGGEPMMQDGMYDFLEYLVECLHLKKLLFLLFLIYFLIHPLR